MNKKLTMKSPRETIVFCVVDENKPLVEQLKTVWGFESGNGMTVDVVNNEVQIIDYYHWSCVAKFDIISFEDTNEEVSLKLTEI